MIKIRIATAPMGDGVIVTVTTEETTVILLGEEVEFIDRRGHEEG